MKLVYIISLTVISFASFGQTTDYNKIIIPERVVSVPFEEKLVQLGGTIASGVSKTLSHLIVGEDAGSKLAKAQKAGVPIHDEQWLVDLFKEYQDYL